MKLFLLVLFYRVSTALFPGDYNFLIHLEVVYEQERLAPKEAKDDYGEQHSDRTNTHTPAKGFASEGERVFVFRGLSEDDGGGDLP